MRTEQQYQLHVLQTRLGLLHFSLSQCKDALHQIQFQRAIERTEAAIAAAS